MLKFMKKSKLSVLKAETIWKNELKVEKLC